MKRMKCYEYYLDTTGDRIKFLNGARRYIFCIEFGMRDYQFYKRLMAGYNQDNEDAKLGLARDSETLYLIEYPMNILNGKIERGQYSCKIG